MIVEVFYALAVFGVAVCWFAICNTITLKQRLATINLVYKPQPEWSLTRLLSKEFNSVSYERHIWQLFTFRDYKKLYPTVYSRAEHE